MAYFSVKLKSEEQYQIHYKGSKELNYTTFLLLSTRANENYDILQSQS